MSEEERAREVLIQAGMHETTDAAIGLVPYTTAIRAMLAFSAPPAPQPDREAIAREARRRLALTEGCLDCNADDERFWRGVIQFLGEIA